MKLKGVLLLFLALVLATMPSWGLKRFDGAAYAKGNKVKAQRVPKDALGFAGMIRGIVKGKTRSGIIFWVGRIVETWKHSKARDAESLIGKIVLVTPRTVKGRNGSKVPYERHVAFMRLLQEGDEITLDVANNPEIDGNERLRLLELTKEQRKWVEKGKIEREEKAEEKEEKEQEEKERERGEEEEEEEPGEGLWKKKRRDREEKEKAEKREREEKEEERHREKKEREREEKDRKHEEKEREREREEKEESSRERERDVERDGLPDGMHGFSGMLGGKVVGKVKNGFILHVKKVLKVWKGNEAKNPKSAIGKRLVILAQWRKGRNGQWHPDERHLRFIRRLENGQYIHIEVINDEGEQLHILELSEEQRK